MMAHAATFQTASVDTGLFAALREGLAGSAVLVHELDPAINDQGFGRNMAEALHAQILRTRAGASQKENQQ